MIIKAVIVVSAVLLFLLLIAAAIEIESLRVRCCKAEKALFKANEQISEYWIHFNKLYEGKK